MDESKGTQQVLVSSATALPATDRIGLPPDCAMSCGAMSMSLSIQNPEHVAGLHIRLGSTVVDSTVRGRLSAMQRVLTKE